MCWKRLINSDGGCLHHEVRRNCSARSGGCLQLLAQTSLVKQNRPATLKTELNGRTETLSSCCFCFIQSCSSRPPGLERCLHSVLIEQKEQLLSEQFKKAICSLSPSVCFYCVLACCTGSELTLHKLLRVPMKMSTRCGQPPSSHDGGGGALWS